MRLDVLRRLTGSVLWCVAVYCSVLQCVAVCRSVSQCFVVCCSMLHCEGGAYECRGLEATDCNTLQYNATLQHATTHCTHCLTLQHSATYCKTQEHTVWDMVLALPARGLNQMYIAHCNTLQHIAAHYNTLQHRAIHCTALRQTWRNQMYIAHCNTLQLSATHCNTMQYTALHYIRHGAGTSSDSLQPNGLGQFSTRPVTFDHPPPPTPSCSHFASCASLSTPLHPQRWGGG